MSKTGFQIVLPSAADLEDPHMIVYTQLQRTWMESVMNTLHTVQQFEQDGACTDSLADRLREDWEACTTSMEAFANFAERHTRRLSPGPGGDPRQCIMCEQKPTRDHGTELCIDCTVIVLTHNV